MVMTWTNEEIHETGHPNPIPFCMTWTSELIPYSLNCNFMSESWLMAGHGQLLGGSISQSLSHIHSLLHQPQSDMFIDSKSMARVTQTWHSAEACKTLSRATSGSSLPPMTGRSEQRGREWHGEGRAEEETHQKAQVALTLDEARQPVQSEEFIHISRWLSDGSPQTHSQGETEAKDVKCLESRQLDLKPKCFLNYVKATGCHSKVSANKASFYLIVLFF